MTLKKDSRKAKVALASLLNGPTSDSYNNTLPAGFNTSTAVRSLNSKTFDSTQPYEHSPNITKELNNLMNGSLKVIPNKSEDKRAAIKKLL